MILIFTSTLMTGLLLLITLIKAFDLLYVNKDLEKMTVYCKEENIEKIRLEHSWSIVDYILEILILGGFGSLTAFCLLVTSYFIHLEWVRPTALALLFVQFLVLTIVVVRLFCVLRFLRERVLSQQAFGKRQMDFQDTLPYL